MLGNSNFVQQEVHDDGALLLFMRKGVFQARIYLGERKYIFKSLKTRDYDTALRLAKKMLFEIEYRKEENLPLHKLSFSTVINEYVALRQQEYDRSQLDIINTSTHRKTSIYMLCQIKRVSKFWHEYCGKVAVERIDNAILKDYVQWRKDYYHNKPKAEWPHGAKPNPTDHTLQWEITLAKTILKYADERRYRGGINLPTWFYAAKKKIVRPPFSDEQLERVLAKMSAMIEEERHVTRKFTRQLLLDYTLILADSGMRLGEANNLKVDDVKKFVDENGNENYRFEVKGKTGKRDVIIRRKANDAIIRTLSRNKAVDEIKNKLVRKNNRKVQNIDNWFFRMYDGNKVITLIDQFKNVLKLIDLEKNRYGEGFTIYSLRHTYAVSMLRKGEPVYNIAKNMGTSVKLIEEYYGRAATSLVLATSLGD